MNVQVCSEYSGCCISMSVYLNCMKTHLKITQFKDHLGFCDWFVDYMFGDQRLKTPIVKVLSVLELVSVS